VSFLSPIASATFLAVDPPPPRLLLETLKAEFVQKYSLSLLQSEFTQFYADTLQVGWAQPYSDMVPVKQEIVHATYKLGFNDVSVEIDQSYGMSVGSEFDQLYSSLQFVQKEIVESSYKLGFDEVSAQVAQPYTLLVEAEFSQLYGSLVAVNTEWEQRYTTSIEVAEEFKSSYTLVENDTVAMNLTSHYTMYSSDNVIVINTTAGLTYKTGYTEAPEI
jgi:hypothetical protein